LRTFVEQKLDFLLREYFRLAVPIYLHAWCILDPIPESLPQLLHCYIGRGNFLTWQRGGVKEIRGSRSVSSLLQKNSFQIGKLFIFAFIGLTAYWKHLANFSTWKSLTMQSP